MIPSTEGAPARAPDGWPVRGREKERTVKETTALKLERRDQIAALISQKRTVTNAELMEMFDISIETVRRDLSTLERQGVLERVYGGAVRREANPQEPGYSVREREHTEEKLAIARCAETLIARNDTVYFDNGTSVLPLARQLRGDKKITAFTNALRTAAVLADKAQAEVILLGGQLKPKELSVSGSDAQEQLARYNVDKAFIGIGGISASSITDFLYAETTLRRQIIQSARQVIALADSSKFSMHAVYNLCPITDIDILITDNAAPEDVLEQIRNQGVQVYVVDPAEPAKGKRS